MYYRTDIAFGFLHGKVVESLTAASVPTYVAMSQWIFHIPELHKAGFEKLKKKKKKEEDYFGIKKEKKEKAFYFILGQSLDYIYVHVKKSLGIRYWSYLFGVIQYWSRMSRW